MSTLIVPIKADAPAKRPKSVVVYGGDATIMTEETAAHLRRMWRLRKMRLMAHVKPCQYLRRDVLIVTNERPLPSAERRLQVIHYDAAMCALRAFLAVPGGAA